MSPSPPVPTWLTTNCTKRNTRIFGRADANGGGSTYLPVYAYTNDLLKNEDGTSIIPCTSQHDCAIIGETSLARTYSVRISFAPSPADCPAQAANAPLGSGSTAATRAMYRWLASTCLPPRSLSAGYVTTSEHDAYRDFFSGLADFGITGLRPSAWASTSSQTYKFAPMSLSAAVLAYRAYDTSGTQITTLTLSPDLIARLYMGQIANFSATQAIKDLNPGISFPPRSLVIGRSDYNSETYLFTSWLSAVAPNTWKPPASESPDIFPAALGLDLKLGEAATAREIIDPPTGFTSDVVYIGLIDSSTAAFYGLPTVKIAMPDGTAVAATSDSILEAIANAQVGSDGILIPQWNNSADPDAYPMPMVTYMIAPTNDIDVAKGDVVAKLLRYAVQDGQALLSDVDGYARLPLNLVQASLAIADLIPVPAPAPSPTPSPPPSTSTDLPPLPLPSLPQVPSASIPRGPASPARVSAPNSVYAALTYSQGLELTAAAHGEVGAVPEEFVLPSLVGLMFMLTAAGLALRLWARRVARRVH